MTLVAPPTERILGISFFKGTALQAFAILKATGGCIVVPASTALAKLKYDGEYARALQQADLVLPDSALLALIWSALGQGSIKKISGTDYLRCLLDEANSETTEQTLWVVSSETAQRQASAHFRQRNMAFEQQKFHVMAEAGSVDRCHALLYEIENLRPAHIVIALRSGVQEKLGIYLRDYLLYRPCIHCLGAGLGFLTGNETAIPEGLSRRNLGWLARLASQPRMILPRLGIAFSVVTMILRYRSEPPPLRPRWSDL